MNTRPISLPGYVWLALALLLFAQATWLFLDARRLGARAWLWGLLGLIQFPVPLLLYWWVVRRSRK